MSENSVDVSEVWGGPGAILRQAREAKGLDATAVAAMLHLSEFKLYALETDDYSSLPEPVFIRGYLRNYARLLNEPEAPVLDAYARHNHGVEIDEKPPLDSHVAVEVSSNHDVVKATTVVIAVILIVLPLIWWWDNLEQAAYKIVGSVTEEMDAEVPSSESVSTEADLSSFMPPPPPGSSEAEGGASEQESLVVEPNKLEITSLDVAPVPESMEPEVLKVNKMPIDGVSGSIAASSPVVAKAEESVSAIKEIVEEVVPVKPAKSKNPLVKPKTKPVVKAVIRKPQPKPKPAAAKVKTSGTLLEFVESSWVKVRDANNQVILIGEYKKGVKKQLSGRTPYKVVLGNSSAVRVMVDGKQADLDKYSSGGVARFTIMSGKIQNP
ncbi:MAG: helix-turn-helix domain-containing protein [Gammaproteobacteria bacterium]|nr:helix-turn-helix domain-containing protein [Gammaproteobacteria bacterium]